MRDGVNRVWIIGVMAVALFGGCRATQVAHDGINFRQALLDMYTDQAMDNLVRARTGQGFVQLNYKDLLVQVTDQYFGELTSQQMTTDNEGLPRKAVMGLIPRVFQNTFSLHGSAQRQGQMSFHADPITDQNDIYDAYLQFANDPALFVVTDCPPPKGAAHIERKCNGHYFWIPEYAAADFQQLMLKTTFQRGKDVSPGYYEATIQKVTDEEVVNPKRSDVRKAYILLDRSVPNGDGSAVVPLPDGKKIRLQTYFVTEDKTKNAVKEGAPTDRLEIHWSPSKNKITAADLENKKVHIYIDRFPPEAAGSDVAEEIRHDLNRVRASISPILPNPR